MTQEHLKSLKYKEKSDIIIKVFTNMEVNEMTTINKEAKTMASEKQAATETPRYTHGCIAAETCKMAAFCGGNCNDKFKSEK